MTNEDKFMSLFYWKRVHQLITSSITKIDSRHGIYQVKDNKNYVNMLKIIKHILKNHASVTLDRFTDQPV